jgi:hypothetical protein
MNSSHPVRILILAFLLGCTSRGAHSPAEAHAHLVAAVSAHDGKRLWDALDQDTRWSWMSIQRAWREAYDITLSTVPEGPERTRLLVRFEPGALSESAQVLFTRMLTPEDWNHLSQLLALAQARTPKDEPGQGASDLATEAGPILYRNARNRHWGWGYAGFAAKAEQTKRTASADLDRVRQDAADYERAAARGAR